MQVQEVGSAVNTASTLSLLSGLSYNADNNITGWLWSNGLARTISYDSFGLVSGYSLGDPAGSGSSAGALRTISRDAAARITGYSHTNKGVPVPSLAQSFGYDNLGRLLYATLESTSTQYAYDANGNRTAKIIAGNVYANTLSASSNRLVQTQDVSGTASVQHDQAGNIISDGANTFTYSERGRMSSASSAGGSVNYLYNALELRIAKSGATSVLPTGAAYYVYNEAGQLLGEYDSNQNPIYETIYVNAMPVGVMKQTGSAGAGNIAVSLYNVHADHLATARMITRQADNAIVWRWDTAEAFGASPADQNPASLGTFTYNQRLPGQVFDQETGLNQNWHREYDPRQGRYRQSDPIGLAGGINTFAYVDDNPLSAVDPMGLQTYSCTRPLEGAPLGISIGPLYHQFLCTIDAKGKATCKGLGPTGGSAGMFGSPGKIETEAEVKPEQCEKKRDQDSCFESCVQRKLGGPLPTYDVRAGNLWGATKNSQQCQIFANKTLDSCALECPK